MPDLEDNASLPGAAGSIANTGTIDTSGTSAQEGTLAGGAVLDLGDTVIGTGTIDSAGTLNADNLRPASVDMLGDPQMLQPASGGPGDEAAVLRSQRIQSDALVAPALKPVTTLIVQTHGGGAGMAGNINLGLIRPQAGDLPPVRDPGFAGNTAIVRPMITEATPRQVDLIRNEVLGDAKALWAKIRVYYGDVDHEFDRLMAHLEHHFSPEPDEEVQEPIVLPEQPEDAA